MTIVELTPEILRQHATVLTRRDAHLAAVVERFGHSPHWTREPGFHTLLHIILEQQVSLASAKAAYERLWAYTGELTPERFLQLDEVVLKKIGFSRQKTRYGRILAQALLGGTLNLSALGQKDDDMVRAELTKLTGIGPWTANVYLLMVLRRPDIWPLGDRALAVAVAEVKQLAAVPNTAELAVIGEQYRPYRSAATHLFWHHYLSR